MSDLFTQPHSNELRALQEALEQVTPAINSGLLSRQELAGLGTTFGGKRDMYKQLGYDPVIPKNAYYQKYTRQDIAGRIIDAYPNAIWSDVPDIVEDDENEELTEFEKAFIDLSQQTELFSVLNRFDRTVRLGEYGVLLIGTNENGGEDYSEPLDSLRDMKDIVYLNPYTQNHAQVRSWVEDVHDSEYGQPEVYSLQTGNYGGGRNAGSKMPQRMLHVHRSRVIHSAEHALENRAFGIPALMQVYNRLMDYEKVVGGSAEMWWLNGRGGLSVQVEQKDNALPADVGAIKTALTNYLDSMSRAISLQGGELKPIEFQVHSPKDHFDVIMAVIAGTTGIPQRILLGSERGELASTQDQNNWNSRIKERRSNFCEKSILRPLINRFIEIGALPPVKEYKVQWPELNELSEKDKAEVGLKKAQALKAYADSDTAHYLVPEQQFVEEFIGIDFKGKEIDDELDKERDEGEDFPDDDKQPDDEGAV